MFHVVQLLALIVIGALPVALVVLAVVELVRRPRRRSRTRKDSAHDDAGRS
jgi:cytochrome c-type biogenesis protein CcmH/NrfF